MKRKDVGDLLIVLNSTGGMFKYPIGNKDLMVKTLEAELKGFIKFNNFTNLWDRV